MIVRIILDPLGANTGPQFNLYSNSTGVFVWFEGPIDKSEFLPPNGYLSVIVPAGTTQIKIENYGEGVICEDDLILDVITTTSTTTVIPPTTTTTTTSVPTTTTTTTVIPTTTTTTTTADPNCIQVLVTIDQRDLEDATGNSEEYMNGVVYIRYDNCNGEDTLVNWNEPVVNDTSICTTIDGLLGYPFYYKNNMPQNASHSSRTRLDSPPVLCGEYEDVKVLDITGYSAVSAITACVNPLVTDIYGDTWSIDTCTYLYTLAPNVYASAGWYLGVGGVFRHYRYWNGYLFTTSGYTPCP